MEREPRHRLILQSDWEVALREQNGKAWISFESGAPSSFYSEIHGHGLSTEGLLYLSGGDEKITVSNITKKSLVVTYNGDQSNLSRKFVCPNLTISTVHSSKKQVTCLDTTSGGLGVSCDNQGNLRLWQTDTGEVRRDFKGHVGDVYSCRFFPSGIVVLSAGADMMVKIWSAETGDCAATLTGHRLAILDTAIVDRGRNILTASRDGTAKLWDVGKQSCLATFSDIGGDVNSCSIGIPENSINLGTEIENMSDREVGTEGKMLLVGCENKSLQAFGLQTREKIFNLECDSAVNTCAFTSEIYAVCGTHAGQLYVIDIRNTSSPLMRWKESRGPILSLLSHKGGFFATTGDGSCFHVDEAHQTTCELTGSDCDPVYKVSTDGANVYTSCRDGAIRKYNLSFVV